MSFTLAKNSAFKKCLSSFLSEQKKLGVKSRKPFENTWKKSILTNFWMRKYQKTGQYSHQPTKLINRKIAQGGGFGNRKIIYPQNL